MSSAPRRRRRWSDAALRGASTDPKMPVLVDGQLTPTLIIQALEVLREDGPEVPMTLAEITEWLGLHVRRPHPPAPSTPVGARGSRALRRHSRPAGWTRRPRSVQEASAA